MVEVDPSARLTLSCGSTPCACPAAGRLEIDRECRRTCRARRIDAVHCADQLLVDLLVRRASTGPATMSKIASNGGPRRAVPSTRSACGMSPGGEDQLAVLAARGGDASSEGWAAPASSRCHARSRDNGGSTPCRLIMPRIEVPWSRQYCFCTRRFVGVDLQPAMYRRFDVDLGKQAVPSRRVQRVVEIEQPDVGSCCNHGGWISGVQRFCRSPCAGQSHPPPALRRGPIKGSNGGAGLRRGETIWQLTAARRGLPWRASGRSGMKILDDQLCADDGTPVTFRRRSTRDAGSGGRHRADALVRISRPATGSMGGHLVLRPGGSRPAPSRSVVTAPPSTCRSTGAPGTPARSVRAGRTSTRGRSARDGELGQRLQEGR